MMSHLRIPFVAALFAISGALAPDGGSPAVVERDGYVGTATCRACHADQYTAWFGSRHRLGLAEAGWIGAGDWRVKLEPSENGWVVGSAAQELVEDGEPRSFDLNDEADLLNQHWSRPGVSFATQCADCHLGDWSPAESNAQSLDLSCESCHGPGATHKDWGMAEMMGRDPEDPTGTKGWTRQLFGADYASWSADPKTGNPPPREVPNARTQVETCARCHAGHEAWLTDRVQAPEHALDAVSPRLVMGRDPGAQDLAAVSSFATSRMHAAGVACSDCHDAHSGALYATDDLLCLRCHEGGRYDAPQHSKHEGDDAPLCIDCHMPRGETGARDHRLLPPGDPLAELLGQPDACSSCHADWSDEDRAQAMAARREAPRESRLQDALAADDMTAWGKLAQDASTAPSLRSVAARRFATTATPQQLAPLLASAEPLVRLGALRGLEERELEPFAELLTPVAADDFRAVRVELGRRIGALSTEQRAAWFGEDQAAIDAAVLESRATR
jgi:cytochrome c554/c'-like protein